MSSETETPPLTLPLVHMNGTGIKTLMEEYEAADDTLRDFIDTWGRMEFNARDYYPLGDSAWSEARDARYEINRKIRDIKDYIDAHRQHLHGQRK